MYSWDLRRDVSQPMMVFSRGDTSTSSLLTDPGVDRSVQRHEPLTNQKMRFDVDSGGRWLGVGSQVNILVITSEGDHDIH